MKPSANLSVSAEQRAAMTSLFAGGRMTSYRAVAAGVAPTIDPFDVYAYNMALAGAYLGVVHVVEVVVRNAMHAELTKHAGRDDWWQALTLVHRQRDELESTIRRLSSARERTHLPPPEPDDIVAALDFGFWTGLLQRGSREEGISYERGIWQHALQYAFPRFHRERRDLEEQMHRARKLRNRISHHEPVHQLDHASVYRSLVQLVSYVSEPVARWMDDRSRLVAVVNAPPSSPAPVRHF